MKAFKAVFKSEVMLMTRNADTLFFGMIMPIGIFLIVGMIMGNKPAFEGANYTFMQQFFPAIATIVICATGLMTVPLTISDYREKKILKRFKVTPVSPMLLLFTHFLIDLIVSFLSLGLLYLIANLFFQYTMLGSAIYFILAFLLVMFAIYGIGMLIASISKNIKMVNLLCTIFYFPMLFLSGATIPYEIMPGIMQKVVDFIPLTQGIKLLKEVSLNLQVENVMGISILMLVIGLGCIAISIKCFRWE